MKNIEYGENKHNRPRSSVFIHTKTPSVAIQGNITAMRYRNDGNRSNLLLHIRANFGMILARDYALCHADKSTLVMRVTKTVQNLRWPAKSLDLYHIDHLLDLLKGKVHAQPLQLNLRELMRVIAQMCAAIPQQYIHRHMLSMSTRFHFYRCDTMWVYNVLKRN